MAELRSEATIILAASVYTDNLCVSMSVRETDSKKEPLCVFKERK